MFAVIRTGGKQYKVAPNEVLAIEKLDAQAGDVIQFADVLMVGGADGAQLDVADANVSATVLEQKRDDKVLVFKKRRRHNYRRTIGHRQYLTVVRIGEIAVAGSVIDESSEPQATSTPVTDAVEEQA